MDKMEAVDALYELQAEIKEKVEEAFEIVSEAGDEALKARAHGYWYASILCELDEDHGFVGGSMCTLQDTINQLEELDMEENDE